MYVSQPQGHWVDFRFGRVRGRMTAPFVKGIRWGNRNLRAKKKVMEAAMLPQVPPFMAAPVHKQHMG